MTSALGGDSVPKLIDVFHEYREAMDATGALGGRREEQAPHLSTSSAPCNRHHHNISVTGDTQAARLVWDHARAEVVERMERAPSVRARVDELAAEVAEGQISTSQAGAMLADGVGRMRGWDDESALR